MTIEQISNLSIHSAMVIYALAAVLYTLEWAAGSRLKPVAVATRTRTRTKAAVGAGGAGSDAADSTVTLDGDDLPADPHQEKASLRLEQFGRMAVATMAIGWVLNLVGMVTRGIAAGRTPWANMYEFTISSTVFAVGIFLVLMRFTQVRWLGLPLSWFASIALGLAVTVFFVDVAPLVPSLHSVWFIIHIVAAVICSAVFTVGGLASVLYLVKAHAEKKGSVGGYLSRLPSSEGIDRLAYGLHAFAFPLWSFTIVAGAIWAEYAWGRFWGFDPKETWSLITWVVYACYLHARVTAGWRGKPAAIIAIVGLVCFWFNFVGVNLLFSGLHSYSGI